MLCEGLGCGCGVVLAVPRAFLLVIDGFNAYRHLRAGMNHLSPEIQLPFDGIASYTLRAVRSALRRLPLRAERRNPMIRMMMYTQHTRLRIINTFKHKTNIRGNWNLPEGCRPRISRHRFVNR